MLFLYKKLYLIHFFIFKHKVIDYNLLLNVLFYNKI